MYISDLWSVFQTTAVIALLSLVVPVCLLFSAIFFVGGYKVLSKEHKSWTGHSRSGVFTGIWTSFPLGVAGIVTGYLTGLSRAPAVQDLVPAALALVSGIALVFLRGSGHRVWVIGLTVLTFSLNILLGVSVGATARSNWVAVTHSVSYQRQQADQEFLIRNYRTALGLPNKPLFDSSSNSETDLQKP